MIDLYRWLLWTLKIIMTKVYLKVVLLLLFFLQKLFFRFVIGALAASDKAVKKDSRIITK